MRLHVNDFDCVPDGRVLERVAIAAGSAVLTSPDGGLRATDVGKNIAIPGGADLGADLDVTIISVDRPDFVGLSNYARRSVTGVTVDLGDRVIHDAAMTLGSRGLTSPTAKFSTRDLGKRVPRKACSSIFCSTP